MIDGLIAGKLYGTAQSRTGQSGKTFATAKVRAASGDGESLIANVIAFDDGVKAALLALDDGDSVATGRFASMRRFSPNFAGTKMIEFEQGQLDAIELDYRAAVKSVNAIAKLHGIPESSLRRMAKKHGWIRGASDIKRKMVEDHFAGVAKGVANDEVRQNQEDAATEDIRDMECGLRIHRLCLRALEAAAVTVAEPKDVKVITEATTMAITSIRKIRGLDTATSGDAADLDAQIEAELEIMLSRRQADAVAHPPELDAP